MDQPPRRALKEQPVERFSPTSGLVAGSVGLALAVLLIATVALEMRTATGLRIALGAALAAVVVWVTQFRPRLTAYRDRLLIRGALRDVHVPYLAIDEVSMGQTLTVWAGGKRYVCIGIGRSIGSDMRQRMRAHSSGDQLGGNRTTDASGLGERPAAVREVSYHSFVLTRIEDLRVAARRAEEDRDADRPSVRTSYAVPEIVALVLTGGAFAVSLLVG